MLLATLSCSRTKDNFFSRTYHRTTSKFNILFNGEQSYQQGYNTLINGHVDRYDEVLAIYPYGTAEQAQSVVPQMDRAIEKSVKTIREHSMPIGGQQKNPYIIDAYLLLAKANFMKQDYFKALEGFMYVIQRYPKSDQVLEARMWAGRTNTRIGNEYAARAHFDEVYNNRDLSSRLEPHVMASMAELEVSKGNWLEASELLKKAIEAGPSRTERIRWQYILGQIYEQQELRFEASEVFAKVVKAHPSNYEMFLNAQLQRALNFDVYQGNVIEVYEDLEGLVEDEKNEEYRDRILYVKALLAIEDQNYPLAEESLRRSVRYSTANQEQKGLSYLLLAEINFEFKSYVKSQAYYDSSYQTLPREHLRFADVERFRSSLNDLVKQIQIIELNDSLMRLSNMSPSNQRRVFEEYIANVKEQEEREAELARNRELNRQLAAESQAFGGGPQAGLSGGTWYFYNETTRSRGISEFSQTWGRRELADNWRRSLSTNPIGGGGEEETFAENEGEEGSENADSGPTGESRYNIDAYLAQIPKDSATKAGMHSENQDAYIRMAGIYREEIQDIEEAIKTYETLLRRYPDGKYSSMSLYALYLLFEEKGESQKAQEIATRLKNQYPSSRFANQLDGTLPEEENANKEALAGYERCYDAYAAKNYRSAKQEAESGLREHGSGPLGAKFDLIYALILAKTEGPGAYEQQLNHVVANYQGTLEAERANELLLYVGNTGAASEMPESPYTVDPKTPHRVLIVVPNGQGDMNAIRNIVSDYNQNFNRFQNLQQQNIFLDRERQLVVISGFIEQADAVQYVQRIQQHAPFSGVFSNEIMRIFAISDANYQTFYREKNVEVYMNFYDQIVSR